MSSVRRTGSARHKVVKCIKCVRCKTSAILETTALESARDGIVWILCLECEALRRAGNATTTEALDGAARDYLRARSFSR